MDHESPIAPRELANRRLFRLDRLESLEILLALLRGAIARGADVEGEHEVQQAAGHEFRRRPAEGDRQVVQRGRHEEQRAEERVGALAREALAEGHRDVLPAAVGLVKTCTYPPIRSTLTCSA